ncbi:MAG: response regulator [Alphaproteobacteria bacterium]|nr:response regulator [Alphaproteobacteria bacterium]
MDKTSKTQYIFVEQIKIIVKQIPLMVGLTMLVALIIFLVLMGKVEVWIQWVLLVSLVTVNSVRLWHYNSLKQVGITVDNVKYHARFLVILAFLGGSAWGSLGLLIPMVPDPFLLILVTTLLCGLVAGAVPNLSVYRPAFFAYSIMCILPFAVRSILMQQEIFVVIGILMLLFLIVNLIISFVAQKSVLKSIVLVQENKKLIENLRQEKSKADAARDIADGNNEAKSRFLAAASHDLRQPLHAMGFFVEALQHEKNPAEISILTKKIGQTSESLRSLLGSLLDISKIEAGVMVPNRSHFTLDEILAEIIQEFAEQAREKGLNLEAKPCCPQVIYSDKEMLCRILRNLVSNAVRYTEQGYVFISCDIENGHVIIHVSDSGVGIAQSKKNDIFQEFYQINDGGEQATQGLGLGLSIVKGLCDLLDHKISLRSEMGVGSVFSIKVPLGNLSKILPETANIHILPGDVSARTIILNNEGVSLESIIAIMRHWGHIVVDFNTCGEVMAFLDSEDFTPDLIISDMQLKDSSGIEAVKAIQEKVAKTIPAIIMTGAGGEKLEQVRDSGFPLLEKPVKPAKLRSMVSFLVQQARES